WDGATPVPAARRAGHRTVSPRQDARRSGAAALRRPTLGRRSQGHHPSDPLAPAERGSAVQGRPDQRRRAGVRVCGLPRDRAVSAGSEDLAFLPVAELGALLRRRRASATELAGYFLDRLERLGPSYNAITYVTRERALVEAAQADREIRAGRWRGPLHGIPYGVKDLLATKGDETTWGAEPYRDQVFDADATVVTRLRNAGAVLVAKLGPMARTAHDCGLVLAAIAGRDPADPSSLERGFRYPVSGGPRRRWRIAVPQGATDGIQAEVAANFAAALDRLRTAAVVVMDVAVPDLPFGVVAGTIIAAEGASAFDDLLESGRIRDLTAPEDRIGGYPALAIPARDYLRAMRVRRLMAQAYDDFLKPFDAVATPTRATVASPLDKAFRDAYPDVKGGVSLIGSSNVVGVPGISVPHGVGLNGLPTGLSFVTRAFDEPKLVRLPRP